jgi:ubiquinone/menaquinone biosynthesis C-methylase UbiE
MPSIEENRSLWNNRYDWPQAGEEWSAAWGGAESQWFGTIFPRVHAFLPAQTILEIAPGFGRWTHYLQGHCEKLIGVDLSPRCVEECRRRFGARPGTEFHENDGTSLAMVPDGSVDFVFSCDSLVHAEADVIVAYLGQMTKKLKPNGVGVIHHSNFGAYADAGATPFENKGWRAQSMTAENFREQCESAGLLCVGQEIFNWWGSPLSDCFSVFTQPGSRWARSYRVLVNDHFIEEANVLSQIMQLYTTASFDKVNARVGAKHVLNWARQTSSVRSARRLPFAREWYRWWKQRLLTGPRAGRG